MEAISKNLLLRVSRFEENAESTISKLYMFSEDNVEAILCLGCEDEYREKKIKGETRIPPDLYLLGSRISPRFSNSYYYDEVNNILIKNNKFELLSSKNKESYKPHELIWIKNVSNFEYVLIHWGNTDLDTDGCYLVGKTKTTFKVKGKDRVGVTNSRETYEKIYPMIFPLVKKGGRYIKFENNILKTR